MTKSITLLLSMLVIITFSQTGYSDEPLTSENVYLAASLFEFWHNAIDCAMEGDYAYAAAGEAGIWAMDISDLSGQNRAISHNAIPQNAVSVLLEDPLLFVADAEFGLRVFNVYDPWFITQIGTLQIEGGAHDLFLDHEIIYVAESIAGFSIVDVSEPERPVLLERFRQNGNSGGIAKTDSLIYLTDINNLGLRIMSVVDGSPTEQIGLFRTAHIRDLAVWNETVFLAQYGECHVIDVSDPQDPRLRGEMIDSQNLNDMDILGEYLYSVGEDGLHITTVTNGPDYPDVGYLETESPASGIAVDLNLVLVAAGQGGVRAVNASNPAEPFETGWFGTYGSAYDLVIENNTACFANGEAGLEMYDVSQPLNLRHLSTLAIEAEARKVYIHDQTAFVVNEQGAIVLIDISSPDQPSIVTTWDQFGDCRDMGFRDEYIFLSDFQNGIRILDASDFNNPQETGLFHIPGLEAHFEICDDWLYFVFGRNRFYVVDISDLTAPVLHNELFVNGNGKGRDIAVNGGYAFVNYEDQGLSIFDIADPGNPQQVAELEIPVGSAIKISGDYAYIEAEGVRVVNVADPAHPHQVGYYQTGKKGGSLAMQDNHAFVPVLHTVHVFDCSDVTGVEDQAMFHPATELLIDAYPNPFNSNTTVTIRNYTGSAGTLALYDLSGRMVMQLDDRLNPTDNVQFIRLNGGQLSAGSYLLRLQSRSGSSSRLLNLVK